MAIAVFKETNTLAMLGVVPQSNLHGFKAIALIESVKLRCINAKRIFVSALSFQPHSTGLTEMTMICNIIAGIRDQSQ